MATSELLGPMRSVDLPGGRIDYHERGAGPPVVFVHGLLVTADLWRQVVPTIADAGFRCLAPDWPLGAHRTPMPPSADLSPPGVAALIAEFLDALGLEDVTIVANDTGGALTQILMTEHPARIGRVVLTPCDAFDCFFPPMLSPLQKAVAIPGMVWVLAQLLRIPLVRRSPAVFGITAKRRMPESVLASYVRPCVENADVRRDLRRFVRGVHRRYTLAAAAKFGGVTQPVLVVAAPEDKIFPAALAERLADALPGARRATVTDSYTFVPEDQPAVLAGLVVDFLRSG